MPGSGTDVPPEVVPPEVVPPEVVPPEVVPPEVVPPEVDEHVMWPQLQVWVCEVGGGLVQVQPWPQLDVVVVVVVVPAIAGAANAMLAAMPVNRIFERFIGLPLIPVEVVKGIQRKVRASCEKSMTCLVNGNSLSIDL